MKDLSMKTDTTLTCSCKENPLTDNLNFMENLRTNFHKFLLSQTLGRRILVCRRSRTMPTTTDGKFGTRMLLLLPNQGNFGFTKTCSHTILILMSVVEWDIIILVVLLMSCNDR